MSNGKQTFDPDSFMAQRQGQDFDPDSFMAQRSKPQGRPIQDKTFMSASKPQSLFSQLGDWWIRKPGTYEGVLGKESPTPRERAQSVMQGIGVASAPLLLASGLEAPVATALGLGGGMAGGAAGSYAGEKIGEAVGAPELGSDVGGLAGSLFGGYGGARASKTVVPRLFRTEGGTGPIRPSLRILSPQRSAVAEELVPRREVPTYPGASLPSAGEFYENRAQDLMQRGDEQAALDRAAAREGRALPVSKSPGPYRGPSSVPKPDPLQGRPSLFSGATSSANPPATELPRANAGTKSTPTGATPTTSSGPSIAKDARIVNAFKTESAPEPSRIIRPGTPEAETPAVQGSYWSFDRQSLLNAAAMDRDAATVFRQRFGELPRNFRYKWDVAEAPTRGLYRGNQ